MSNLDELVRIRKAIEDEDFVFFPTIQLPDRDWFRFYCQENSVILLIELLNKYNLKFEKISSFYEQVIINISFITNKQETILLFLEELFVDDRARYQKFKKDKKIYLKVEEKLQKDFQLLTKLSNNKKELTVIDSILNKNYDSYYNSPSSYFSRAVKRVNKFYLNQ